MRLYTIQPREFWDNLCVHGKIVADPREVETSFIFEEETDRKYKSKNTWGFRQAYAWLIAEMRKKISSSHMYPIWAWAGRKPDLRTERWQWCNGYTNKGAVRIGFEVDEASALLSDFDGWHYVLNYWYFGDTEGEAAAFEHRVQKETGCSYYERKPLKHKSLDQEVQSSWGKIFDLKRCADIFGDVKQYVQATVWELSASQVFEVTPFMPRRKKGR